MLLVVMIHSFSDEKDTRNQETERPLEPCNQTVSHVRLRCASALVFVREDEYKCTKRPQGPSLCSWSKFCSLHLTKFLLLTTWVAFSSLGNHPKAKSSHLNHLSFAQDEI